MDQRKFFLTTAPGRLFAAAIPGIGMLASASISWQTASWWGSFWTAPPLLR